MKITHILIAFVIAYALFFLTRVPDITATDDFPLIRGAHRGSSVEYPENTLEAINASMSDPDFKFIEFDLQYTKDKKIVVFHDYTLIRLHGKLQLVSQMTYDELLDTFDYHIPVFEEVMELIGDNKSLNIEIKPSGNVAADIELIEYVIAYCQDDLDKIMISSISEEVVNYISTKYPEIKTGMVYFVLPVTYLKSKLVIQNFYNNMEDLGVDYILLHGVNINNYDLLFDMKPENVTLVFWYQTTDSMFIVQKDETDVLW